MCAAARTARRPAHWRQRGVPRLHVCCRPRHARAGGDCASSSLPAMPQAPVHQRMHRRSHASSSCFAQLRVTPLSPACCMKLSPRALAGWPELPLVWLVFSDVVGATRPDAAIHTHEPPTAAMDHRTPASPALVSAGAARATRSHALAPSSHQTAPATRVT